MINPLTLYSVFFLFALVLNLLHWSIYFPSISGKLLFFLLSTIFVALFIGFLQKEKIKMLTKGKINISIKIIKYCLVFVFFVTIIDGIYSGGFPLLGQVDYSTYGMPILHPFLILFSESLFILTFNTYLVDERAETLFLAILFFIPPVVALSRGTFLIEILIAVWCYVYTKKINLKKGITIFFIGVFSVYVFGISGNYRLNNQVENTSGIKNIEDSTLIKQVGGINTDILEKVNLSPLYWTYVYAASPVANLQKTVDSYGDITEQNTRKFFITQFMMDFFSKRVYPNYANEKKASSLMTQVNSTLTVGTAYRESYILLGWLGLFFFATGIFLFELIYIKLLSAFAPEFATIGIAILNSIYCLLIFSNMLVYSGVSMLLVLPFVLKFLKIIRINKKV